MKRIILTLAAAILAVFFAAPPCFAQQKSALEPIAPLINEKNARGGASQPESD